MPGIEQIVAIINPAAGHGRAARRWQAVRAHLLAAGCASMSRVTRERGDAERLAREAIEAGCRTIVAVGGDGTVHEVLNAFLVGGTLRDDVRLGVVPAGTGMDVVRNARLPRRADRVARALLADADRRLDVGLSAAGGQRAFINFAETGLGAAVVARESAMSDAWPGRLSFLLAALGASVQKEAISATIRVDEQVVYDGRLVSVVVANGRFFGGGMKIAPRASMTDGRLDILVLGDFGKTELVSQIWKIYPGVHLSHPKVLWMQGARVDISPWTPTRLDLDGELHGNGPYSFTVLSRALRVAG